MLRDKFMETTGRDLRRSLESIKFKEMSLVEVNNKTVQMFGFLDSDDYSDQVACAQYIKNIGTPSLFLSA